MCESLTKFSLWRMAFVACVVVFPTAPIHAETNELDERTEPPLEVRVDIGGERANVTLGAESIIKVGGQELKLRLTPSPKRTLRLSGIRFDYPRHFAFEYDGEAQPLEIWSLDGNSVVIMVQRYPRALGDLTELFAKEIVDQYGEGNVEQTNTTITLAGKTRPGRLLSIRLLGDDGMILTQTLFGWLENRHGYLLILQDSMTDDGVHTNEYKHALLMLTKSFSDRPKGVQKNDAPQ